MPETLDLCHVREGWEAVEESLLKRWIEDGIERCGQSAGVADMTKRRTDQARLDRAYQAGCSAVTDVPEPVSVPRALAAVHVQNFARHETGRKYLGRTSILRSRCDASKAGEPKNAGRSETINA
jgi:hypothetical protein